MSSLDRDIKFSDGQLFTEPFDFGRTEKVPPDPPRDKVSAKVEDSNPDPSLLQQFATETSAHGCAHAASPSRTTFSRVVWALAVAFMLGSMIYTLYSMLKAYDQYPVNTLTKVTVKPSLPFPGITLCNINEVDVNKTPLDADLFRTFKTEAIFGIQALNRSDPTVRELLDTPIDNVVNSSWTDNYEFIVGCYINDAWVYCPEIFNIVQSSRTRCATLNTNHSTLRTMSYAGPLSGLRLYLYVHQEGYVMGNSVAAGVQLFVHEPGHLPDLLSSGFLLSPGFSTYVATRPVQYKFLPKPYMAYGDEACVDVHDPSDPSFPQQLRLSDKYSFAACNLQCTVDAVAEKCGCRGVLNEENSTLSMCTVEEFYECYDREMSQLYFNISAENRCNCPRPCDFTEYSTQISSAYFPSDVATTTLQYFQILPKTGVRENYMELRVYLDKLLLEEVVHEPVYTYITVMGTIGGQMGFFLGASVLTLAELAELCLCFLFRMLRRISGPQQRIGHTRVIPVKPKTSEAFS